MEAGQLCVALQACLSPDPTVRQAAGGALKQAKALPGQVVALLQVAVLESADLGTRQSAAIAFKQLVHRAWSPPEDEADALRLSDADKVAVRANALEAMVRSPPLVRQQLQESVKAIVMVDFPTGWPGLMEEVFKNLNSGETPRIHGGLIILRLVAHKYEFRDEEARAPMNEVSTAVFPGLLQIFGQLVETPTADPAAAELMKLICKIFWSSTYLRLPPVMLQSQMLQGWLTCFLTLLERPVPKEGEPEDPELRNAWPWWKLKKWVLHILGRLHNRFCDPKNIKDDRPGEKAFAEFFQRECSVKFLTSHMDMLFGLPRGQYLSPRVINQALHYVYHTVDEKELFKAAVKPRLSELVVTVVLPLMFFDQEDAELWEDDPQEYVRKSYDFFEDLYSPRTAAVNLLVELVTTQGKSTLEMVMGHLTQLVQAAAQPGAGEDVQRMLYGALMAIGSMEDKLKRSKTYKPQLEQMLTQFVAPLFNSPFGYVRGRACWVCGQFADIRFKEGRGAGQSFLTLMQLVLGRLQDPELPVKVDAVVALRNFIEAVVDLDTVRPVLPTLLDEFFKLMSQIENEDLVMTLESIVEKFGDEISPYAFGLCQNLAAAFWKLSQTGGDEDDDEMGALAAVGCLRAISTILESVSSLPELYVQLEPVLFPIMQKMTTQEGQDVYEEVLEIVSYFTYISPQISEAMWGLWPNFITVREPQTSRPADISPSLPGGRPPPSPQPPPATNLPTQSRLPHSPMTPDYAIVAALPYQRLAGCHVCLPGGSVASVDLERIHTSRKPADTPRLSFPTGDGHLGS